VPSPVPQPAVGLAAEHGFFVKPPGVSRWHSRFPLADNSWQAMVMPILKQVGKGRSMQSAPPTVNWVLCSNSSTDRCSCRIELVALRLQGPGCHIGMDFYNKLADRCCAVL
jgi:hypothetical protein